jgi:hypothetical protein
MAMPQECFYLVLVLVEQEAKLFLKWLLTQLFLIASLPSTDLFRCRAAVDVTKKSTLSIRFRIANAYLCDLATCHISAD